MVCLTSDCARNAVLNYANHVESILNKLSLNIVHFVKANNSPSAKISKSGYTNKKTQTQIKS